MKIVIWLTAIWGSIWSLRWISFAWQGFKFRNQRIWLHNLPIERSPFRKSQWPSVSIIVPACNEAASIERCLKTLLNQDYPHFEIIAINDRSTDDTGKILDQVAKTHNRLTVLHISDLPPGWIGRCHAFEVGGGRAKGDFILFVDSDLMWDPTVLKRTILYMENNNIDYVSVLLKRIFINIWEEVFVLAFYNLMNSLGPIWKVSDPDSHVSIGVGSFSLFRREVFERLEGLQHLRLSIADDQALAAAVKAHGFKSRLILSENLLEIRWQEGLIGHICGLEKNCFATFGFRYTTTFKMIVRNFSVNLAPFLSFAVGLSLRSIPILLISLAGILSIWTVTLLYHRQVMRRFYEILFLPFGAVFYGASVAWSAWRAFSLGGCKWKNKFYPLKDLINHNNQRQEWLDQAWSTRKKASLQEPSRPQRKAM